MKTLLLSLLITLYGGLVTYAQTSFPKEQKSDSKPIPQTSDKAAPKVYICKGGSAYAYHKSMACEGLTFCTRDIVAVAKKEAELNHKRRPCKACY